VVGRHCVCVDLWICEPVVHFQSDRQINMEHLYNDIRNYIWRGNWSILWETGPSAEVLPERTCEHNGKWLLVVQFTVLLRDNNFGLCVDCRVWIHNLIEKECLVPKWMCLYVSVSTVSWKNVPEWKYITFIFICAVCKEWQFSKYRGFHPVKWSHLIPAKYQTPDSRSFSSLFNWVLARFLPVFYLEKIYHSLNYVDS